MRTIRRHAQTALLSIVCASASFMMLTGCSGGGSSSGAASSGFSSSGGASSGASSSGSTSSGTTSGLASSSGSSTSGGPNGDGCSDAARLVYVLSDTGELYSFAPDKLLFTKIGDVNCPGEIGFNSMAVDRSGTAWVNGQSGSLYKVSTADASCVATRYTPDTGNFRTFGMAFSADVAGEKAESLYVASNASVNTGDGLAKIDTTTYKLTKIGNYGGVVNSTSAELTGTGSAKLYGFFTTTPAKLGDIAKTSGVTSAIKDLNGVNTGNAFAFSFWGGDFWFYTAGATGGSNVTRLKAATDNSIGVVKANVGFRIVGAGVSTCAPIVPVVN
jgi:hypothetical protein